VSLSSLGLIRLGLYVPLQAATIMLIIERESLLITDVAHRSVIYDTVSVNILTGERCGDTQAAKQLLPNYGCTLADERTSLTLRWFVCCHEATVRRTVA